jgi:hypothetical protein
MVNTMKFLNETETTLAIEEMARIQVILDNLEDPCNLPALEEVLEIDQLRVVKAALWRMWESYKDDID